jgi:hypothetical protein
VTFKEVLTKVLEWLQHDQRVSYRALKRQFTLDDAYLEDLQYARIEVQELATDCEGTMLLLTGGPVVPSASVPPSAPSKLLSAPQDVHRVQPAVEARGLFGRHVPDV